MNTQISTSNKLYMLIYFEKFEQVHASIIYAIDFQWLKYHWYDRNIRAGPGCLGYPCKLGLKIYNNNLRDDRFNGYYIQTFSHSCMYDSIYLIMCQL